MSKLVTSSYASIVLVLNASYVHVSSFKEAVPISSYTETEDHLARIECLLCALAVRGRYSQSGVPARSVSSAANG